MWEDDNHETAKKVAHVEVTYDSQEINCKFCLAEIQKVKEVIEQHDAL